MKSKALSKLKLKHRYISTWAKQHDFHVSTVNDLLSKRGVYGVPNYTAPETSNAYAILQTLLLEGYAEELLADGWDISSIDITKPVTVHKRKSITLHKHTNLPTCTTASSKTTDLETICMEVNDLGYAYTCSLFIAPCEGGPVAILYMMEHSSKATDEALLFLQSTYMQYKFYKETAEVISIWEN